MRERRWRKGAPREKEQEGEEQLMDDKKRKKEDKKRKEAAQKVTEQKTKVPDVTKTSLSQPPAASPLGSAPSPPVNGGNNAKRVAAVPNGQPPSAARYMPREVPPRFRCQQDHKVLLKRGQPPPASCMLLGGGAGPPPSAAAPGANAQPASGALQQGDSGSAPDSAPGGAAASNYANSTWGAGASSNSSTLANPPQIWDKVIVDGSDMEEWPCIASKDTEPPPEMAPDNNSASNVGPPEKVPQPGSATSNKGRGVQAGPGSTGSECNLGPWKGDPKAKPVQPPNPPADNSSGLGNWRILGGQDRVGPGSGFSNFNPNTNPTAWPALNQDGLPSRNGVLDAEGANPDAQLSTAGLLPREQQQQQSKVENAGVNFVISGREQAQTHNTDGPKNANTNSLNTSSPNPMENKGIPFGAGSGSRSRSTDAPSQSTGERKNGGVGSWSGARGPPGTDAVSGQSNYGNNGNNGREESWKGASASKPSGSRSDPWDGNSRSTGGGSWGFCPQDPNDGKWCEGNKAAAAGVSQGEWQPPPGSEDPKIAEWGGPNQPNSTSTGAWDNQKGHPLPENQGSAQAPCWGRSSSSAGSEAGGQSTGSNHKAGSGDSLTSGRRTHRAPLPDSQVALQTMLSRPDLDPRVLSNTGWGQTQIKQDTVWEMAEAARPEGKADKGTEGWEKSSTQPKSAGGGWAEAPSQNNQNKSGWGEPAASTEWKDPKNAGGWSDYKNNSNWGSGGGNNNGGGGGGGGGGVRGGGDGVRSDDKPPSSWSENASSKDAGWSGRPPNPGWSGGKNGWGGVEGAEPAKGGGGGGGGWDGSGNKAPPNWGEAGQPNEIGTWGNGGNMGNTGNAGNANPVAKGGWDDCKRAQGWSEQTRPPHSWNKPQEVSGSWGGPQPAPAPSNGRPQPPPTQNSNWKNVPPPQQQHQQQHQSNSSRDEEASGWEEPSPQSISRKMEIDDGTSAWGDPTSYNYKSVNLWDKNAKGGPGQGPRDQNLPVPLNNKGGPSVTLAAARTERPPQAREVEKPRQQPPLPPPQQQQHSHRTAAEPPRWPEPEPPRGIGIWGKNKASSADNGTSAWGEPTEAASGWGDGEDSGPPTPGWGTAPPNVANSMKPGAKSMQDGWGESDAGGPGARHSSWDEDEEGGVWNSAGVPGGSSSHNAAGWAPGSSKKPQIKGSLKGGSAEPWMNPLSKQFSNMGLLNQVEDPSGSKMDMSVGGLADKKFDTDKRGMNLGDYNDNMRKDRSGFRPPNSKDMGVTDNGPYYEKGGNHGLFGNSAAQSRGMHTPAQPLNSSPNLRAQGPPQFLPPQASMLKQFPNNSLNPGLFNMAPQLSPQQIAMLSQLPQIPQFQLACQLLLQQQQQQHLLQNQRKISQAVRQQQEQQLARMVNALQQQQRQPGMKHSPSHPVGPKQHMDSGLADLQAKGQIPGYGSGFGSGGMEYGMGGGKDTVAESRFKQWTSMIDGLPSVAQEVNMHKNGAIVPPGKARGGSPYNQYDMMSGDHLGGHPGPTGDSWLPAKSPPTNKIGSKSSNASWPPEFQPGVPWKGIQNIDPESDPYVTPGSVLGGPATSPIIDTDHQLLRDNTTGSNSSLHTSMPSQGAWPYSASNNSYSNIHSTSAKFTDYKSTWTPDPIGPNPAHLSHKMWKSQMSRNTTGLPRPPPGLSNPKPSSPWNSTAPRSVRDWGGQESRFVSASTWSDGMRPSYWLVLHNLTPQIDGSTLRTICMQHGPLLTFHLNLTQGTALIRYSTKQEAAKAQSALHMCVLGNTTILAEFATDEEVSRFLAQSQPPTPTATQTNPNAGWQSLETGQSQADPGGPALNLFGGSTGLGQWSGGGGGAGGADLAGASLWGPSNYSSSLWGVPSVEDPHRMGSPAPLLPGDLLGGGSDSI